MWNSFGPKPRILRIYGVGEVVLPGQPRFNDLKQLFPEFRALRSIIEIQVTRIADSCGFGVPEMELVGQRSRLIKWGDNRSEDELEDYKRENNAVSIDGLPALSGSD